MCQQVEPSGHVNEFVALPPAHSGKPPAYRKAFSKSLGGYAS